MASHHARLPLARPGPAGTEGLLGSAAILVLMPALASPKRAGTLAQALDAPEVGRWLVVLCIVQALCIGLLVARRVGRPRRDSGRNGAGGSLRLLFDHMPDPLFITDRAGKIHDANSAACHALGYTREELLARTVGDIDPGLADQMAAGIWDPLDGQDGVEVTARARHRRRDGTLFPVEIRASRFEWEGQSRLLACARDLTHREESEAALRLNEERLRKQEFHLSLAMETALSIVFVWEIHEDRVYRLQSTEDALPATANFPGTFDQVVAALYPDDRSAFRENVQRALQAADGRYESEHRILRPDGCCRWHEEHGRVEFDGEHRPIRLVGISRDVTERKETEQRLRQQAAILDLMTEAVNLTDESGRLTYTNAGFDRLFAYEPGELIGRHVSCLNAYDDSENQEVVRKILADLESRGTWRGEVLNRRKDGSVFVSSGSIVAQPTGAGWRYLSVQADITAQDQAEEALRLSEERFRKAILQAPIPICLAAEDGEFLAISDMFCELTGYSREELRTVDDWMSRAYGPQAPSVRTGFDRLLQSDRRVDEGEFEVRTADGGRRVWDFSSSPLGRLPDGRRLLLSMAKDVTERCRAEEALRESEQRYRTIAQNVPGAVYEFRRGPDGSTGFTFVSPRVVELFDIPLPESGDPTPLASFLTPEDGGRFVTSVRAAIASGSDWQFEGCIIGRDGVRRHCQILSQACRVGDEVVWNGLMLDITQRARAEADLRQSERRYRAVVDQATDPLYIVDRDGRLVDCNRAACEALGYERDQLLQLGLRAIDLDFPLVPPADLLGSADAISGRGQVISTRHRRSDGSVFPVEVRVGLLELDDEILYIGIARDIGERVRVETEIRTMNAELERRVASRTADVRNLARIIDSSTDFIATATPDGVPLWENAAFRRVAGLSEESTLRPGSISALHPPESTELILEVGIPTAIRDGHWTGETEVHTTDGRFVPVSQLILSHRGEDGEVAFVSTIMRDITERKRLEAELRERSAELTRANAELSRASRLKDEFLASMSHELRTPLNGVLGLTEAVREGVYGPVNSEQADVLGDVERCGRHLLSLINDILDLSKIEAGRMELDLVPGSVEEVCRASIRIVREMAQRKRQDLRLHVEELSAPVLLDERRVKQILVNLLSNAVKFSGEGTSIVLEASVDHPHELIQLAVRDQGIGLRPEDLAVVFLPFRQIDSRLARSYPGTGLGLALVRRLAELHGGSVTVVSEPGQGSCFTVSLPLIREPAGDALADPAGPLRVADHREKSPTAADSTPATDLRVLVVDDNEVNARVAHDHLQAAGFTVAVAVDGAEAIRLAEAFDPRVILMDIQMPEMDGLAAIRALRADPRWYGVPILAVSALVLPGDREACAAAGATAYLAKPYSPRELVAIIRTMLDPGQTAAAPADHHRNDPSQAAS